MQKTLKVADALGAAACAALRQMGSLQMAGRVHLVGKMLCLKYGAQLAHTLQFVGQFFLKTPEHECGFHHCLPGISGG